MGTPGVDTEFEVGARSADGYRREILQPRAPTFIVLACISLACMGEGAPAARHGVRMPLGERAKQLSRCPFGNDH